MKSKLISVFITTTLTTIGLCCTISHASEKQFIIQNSNSNSSLYANQAQQTLSPVAFISIDKVINKPLLNIYSSIATEYMSEDKFDKKNEVFELATIFNDKLQQFLAKLSFNETASDKNNFINNDKPNNDNSINCSSIKH